ncbi:hypothetical protein Gotri_002366 [Gossypium trilobum]|uniref:Uncharacterized protein n=1 Tax=Gossypium trilobum TaxID=34281 RepID=A0A7J9F812_9ROSI|nr:hypothetical protein [Gossypium trilobum]
MPKEDKPKNNRKSARKVFQ